MVPRRVEARTLRTERMSRTSFFTNESMIRRIQRESVVGLSGPRTLLMQAAHPVAFAGFFAHTGALDDPYGRLQRTVRVLGLIGFGDKREAQAATRRVREIHTTIHGELPRAAGRFPAGTPYSAEDPELLLWILACMADSALVVYERYVRSLSRAERDGFWQDYKVVGREFGLCDADLPDAIEDFDDYMRDMVSGDDLYVTDEARELGLQIVMRPPVPLHARPMLELANFATIGLLPPRIRRMYGLSWDPARALVLRGGSEYAKRVVVPLLPHRLRYRRRRRAHA
jgi:uncharacterized protein (DUF2236 family)